MSIISGYRALYHIVKFPISLTSALSASPAESPTPAGDNLAIWRLGSSAQAVKSHLNRQENAT